MPDFVVPQGFPPEIQDSNFGTFFIQTQTTISTIRGVGRFDYEKSLYSSDKLKDYQ